MAAGDATWNPKKGVAYRVTFPILDADGDLVTGATGLDSEVSKDGGTFTDCTSEATEIATSSGVYYLDLTATEMNADTVAVIVKTSSSGAKTTVLVFYPLETADMPVDVLAISGDTVAADNLEAAADGTGYNLGGGSIVAASVTGAVGSIGAGGITTASFATGAIDANAMNVTGSEFTAIPWNASWDAEVQSEVQDAIEANHLDHLLAVTYDPAAKPGVSDALFNELVQNNGSGISQFTTTALELAPSGGGGGTTDWTANERTAIRSILGIPTSGTTPTDPTAGILDTIRDTFPANFAALGINGSGHLSRVTLVDTCTTNTDMRGTDNAALAASWTATRAGYLDSVLIAANANQRTVQVTGSNHVAADIHELQPAVIDNTHFAAGAIDSNAIAASAATEIATATLGATVEGSETLTQAVRLMRAALVGKLSGAATTTVTIRDAADTKNRITATVTADGNRTDVTTDAT